FSSGFLHLFDKDVVQGSLDQLEFRHNSASINQSLQQHLWIGARHQQHLELVADLSNISHDFGIVKQRIAALESQRHGVARAAAANVAELAIKNLARSIDHADVVAKLLGNFHLMS